MVQVGQVIGHQLTTSLQHNKHTFSVLRHLSQRQQTELEKFLEAFPTIEKVYSFFCPNRWEYALKHVNECLHYPCISLAQVDEVYHTIGAARNIIRGMFIGLYSLSTAREEYNTQASNLAADLFISKYGHQCSLYDSMLYFGGYITEYKQSFSQYDIQDVLQQYSRKYLVWKQLRQSPEQETEVKDHGISLPEMILIWLRERRTEEQIKEGGLYRIGSITVKMIEAARNEFESERNGLAF